MNSLVKREFSLLEQTLALRTQLLDMLTYADLNCAPHGNQSFGELCREAGRLDEIYIEITIARKRKQAAKNGISIFSRMWHVCSCLTC